ncbi:MAG: acyltransferase [Blautia sp.]|nr:acyltransferase [Blautia sp.]
MTHDLYIKSNQRQYEIIDYLKGFSIITIALGHLIQCLDIPGMIYTLSSLGGTGVHVFFLCSGFGLYASHRKKELRFPEFIKKRFLKIYLPYIFVVLILFFLPFTFDGSFRERVVALLSHVFLFKMFVPELEGSFCYPFWYMSTLFQFYLLFIPLCNLKKRMKTRTFVIICVGASVLWWILSVSLGIASERIWGSLFLQYLWEFAIGMALAEYLAGKDLKVKLWVLAAVAGIGLATGGFLAVKGGFLKSFNDFFLMSGYLSAAVILYLFLPFVKKICLQVNQISYELYLVHDNCNRAVFIYIYGALISNQYVAAVVALVIGLVVAVIFNRMIRKASRLAM